MVFPRKFSSWSYSTVEHGYLHINYWFNIFAIVSYSFSLYLLISNQHIVVYTTPIDFNYRIYPLFYVSYKLQYGLQVFSSWFSCKLFVKLYTSIINLKYSYIIRGILLYIVYQINPTYQLDSDPYLEIVCLALIQEFHL